MSSMLSANKHLSKHLHTLSRSKSNKSIFRCIDPHCTYYQKAEFIEGKEVLCKLCGRSFLIDASQLRNAVPRCEFCQNTKKSRAMKASLEKLSSLIDTNLQEEFRDEEIPQLPEPIIEPNPFLLTQEKKEE